MSVCGQNGQAEEDSASEEVTAGAAVRDYYKQKPASKVVRVLTVLAYLLSVSLAAILLSVYYVCVWRSPELPKLNETGVVGPAARRDPRPDHAVGQSEYPTIGGGDSGVNALVASATLDSTAVPFIPSDFTGGDPTTDSQESVADNYTSEPFNSTSDYESTSNNTDVT